MSSPRRTKPDAYKPPAEFGQRAIELCEQAGKDPEDLVRAVGYESKKTLYRLAKGEGSLEFALAIRDELEAWGLDVSTLPPLGLRLDPADLEWLDIGRQLRRIMSDDGFTKEKELLLEVIRAHRIVAEGTAPLRKR